jgi:hypothetical protein
VEKAKQEVVKAPTEYKRREIFPVSDIGIESYDDESDDRRPKKRKDRKKGESPKRMWNQIFVSGTGSLRYLSALIYMKTEGQG